MSHNDTSAGQLAQARAVVGEHLDELRFLIGWAHEEAGCLPLPDLRVPGTGEQLTAYAKELAANLFQPGANVSAVWAEAIERCGHVAAGRAAEIHELIVYWYRIVVAAASQVNGPRPIVGMKAAVAHFERRASVFRGGEDGNRCRCGARNDDGEGYDGDCGNCADRKEAGRG